MNKQKPSWVVDITADNWLKESANTRALFVMGSMATLKVREIGSNAGAWVKKILASVGLGEGYSWCGAGLYYSLIEAGADPKKMPEKHLAASVYQWYVWAKNTGRLLKKPKRGAAMFWLDRKKVGKNVNWQGHIGPVRGLEPLDENLFYTIEGNTNAKGSREGDGVYRKDRTMTELKKHERFGFIDLGGLD
jgi:hypothetical protein